MPSVMPWCPGRPCTLSPCDLVCVETRHLLFTDSFFLSSPGGCRAAERESPYGDGGPPGERPHDTCFCVSFTETSCGNSFTFPVAIVMWRECGRDPGHSLALMLFLTGPLPPPHL